MKGFISMMLLVACMHAPAIGCDVCGCSASNQFLGILPGYNYNFVGFQYLRSNFTSDHPSLYENRPNEHSADRYHTFQVWGRYNLGSHYQLFAFIPYQQNTHNEDSANAKSSGIGDISVLVNRVFLKNEEGKIKHLLLAGLGIKAPTGQHTGLSTLDKLGLPNMQPGSGSWDFIANANYTLGYKKTGINLDAAYTLTTVDKYQYKYGNRLNSGLTAFYSFAWKKLSVVPQIGARYEYTLHDYDNYTRKWLNDQSGGHLCYVSAGMQTYYKKMGARLTYQLPVSQHYGAGYVTALHKVEAGIFLLF